MKYQINSFLFKTDKAVQEAAKKILYDAKLNNPLPKYEFNFMHEYFKVLHHEFKQKQGTGIKNIIVGMDKTYGKNRAFTIERIDGTFTDISYIVSNIKAPNLDKDFRQALRQVIEPQIHEFKLSAFEGGSKAKRCPITSEVIRYGYCHIDHFSPTFEQLVLDFIKTYNLSDLSKLVAPNRDNQTFAELQCDKTARLFFDYHKKNASLRALSPKANLTRSK